MLPPPRPPEELPEQFDGLSGHEATDWAKTDADRYHALRGKKTFTLIFALVLLLAGAVMLKAYPTPGMICCGVGLAVLVWWLVEQLFRSREIRRLEEFYGSADTENWLALARQYARGLEQRQRDPEEISPEQRELEEQIRETDTQLSSIVSELEQGQEALKARRDALQKTQGDILKLNSRLDGLIMQLVD